MSDQELKADYFIKSSIPRTLACSVRLDPMVFEGVKGAGDEMIGMKIVKAVDAIKELAAKEKINLKKDVRVEVFITENLEFEK